MDMQTSSSDDYTNEPGTPVVEDGVEQPDIAELDQDDLLQLDIPSCDNLYLKGNPNVLQSFSGGESETSRKRSIGELNGGDIPPKITGNSVVDNSDDDEGMDTDVYQPSLQFNDNITTPPVYPTFMGKNSKSDYSKKKYSSAQQAKFMNFCEDEFMNIQRKYVQSRGLQMGERPKPNVAYYDGLLPLLKDMKRLIDLVWYSMDTSCKNTENLIPNPQSLHGKLFSSGEEEEEEEEKEGEVEYTSPLHTSFSDGHFSYKSLRKLLNEAQNIGQVYVLLKIADELGDYIEKFQTKPDSDAESIKHIFMLHFILDRVFSLLILSGSDVKYGVYMSQTEIVRCKGICERSRINLAKYFQDCNIKGFHYELSKIYELTLERI